MNKLMVALSAVLLITACATTDKQANSNRIRIAITFDDLPVHGGLPPQVTRQKIHQDIVAALKAVNVPQVYGFVNASSFEKQPAFEQVLVDWRAAGYTLGNHTWSHPNINDLSSAAYTEEIIKNEAVLQKYSQNMDWHWFRYPFLAEGNDPTKRKSIRDALAKRGYRIAQVTMSFGDYMWNDPYARCVAKADVNAIQQLEASFLKAAADELDRSRSMSMTLYGRDIPYVLLMHVGGFDARMMPQLLAMYKSKGVEFVTLEQAQNDEFYASDNSPALAAGPVGLEQHMASRGLSLPARQPLGVRLNSLCQ